MKVLYINFDYLKFDSGKQKFLEEHIINTIKDKFSDTEVFVTTSKEMAHTIVQHARPKTIFIHNDDELNISGEAGYGMRIHRDFAEVNVDQISQSLFNGDYEADLDIFGNQIGTIASHEAGHLFLPPGHSIVGVNLMSDGAVNNQYLLTNQMDKLQFTDFQKNIIRGDVQINEDASLPEIELSVIGGAKLPPWEDPQGGGTNDFDSSDVSDFELPF